MKVDRETGSDCGIREDLPMRAIGNFLCAEYGEDRHTYGVERKGHKGNQGPDASEKQISLGLGVKSS